MLLERRHIPFDRRHMLATTSVATAAGAVSRPKKQVTFNPGTKDGDNYDVSLGAYVDGSNSDGISQDASKQQSIRAGVLSQISTYTPTDTPLTDRPYIPYNSDDENDD